MAYPKSAIYFSLLLWFAIPAGAETPAQALQWFRHSTGIGHQIELRDGTGYLKISPEDLRYGFERIDQAIEASLEKSPKDPNALQQKEYAKKVRSILEACVLTVPSLEKGRSVTGVFATLDTEDKPTVMSKKSELSWIPQRYFPSTATRAGSGTPTTTRGMEPIEFGDELLQLIRSPDNALLTSEELLKNFVSVKLRYETNKPRWNDREMPTSRSLALDALEGAVEKATPEDLARGRTADALYEFVGRMFRLTGLSRYESPPGGLDRARLAQARRIYRKLSAKTQIRRSHRLAVRLVVKDEALGFWLGESPPGADGGGDKIKRSPDCPYDML